MYVSRPGQVGSSDTRSSSPFPDDASDGASSSQSTIVQLTENFRLNPDLGEFVSTIYSKAFRPQKVQARRIALALSSIPQSKTSQATSEYLKILDFAQRFLLGLSHIMLKRPQRDLSPPLLSNLKEHTHSNDLYSSDVAPHPLSLALIQLYTISRKHRDNVGYELHVKAEAAVTAALIAVIQEYLPGEDIFVATPHRIQRQAVRAALLAQHFETLSELFDEMTLDGGKKKSTVTVDTIERLQGSEAAFVICLFSLPQSHITDLQFLLERRRLNVAISRAKSMCILISSNEVLRPAVGVLTDGETAKGYTFLRAFADRAWSSNVSVDIDALNL
ncbi:AAA domain-containing protein [Lentinula aff. detonsa]|uniref:AAA domain-containing protein n=1 Tax=Lentinula aff. detonsa TaxID=2804958 RepID=A0AA38KQ44_9AGAR|nr:AAA domain-containing protein [Lentinula aff. detonsa]KAJ3797162.1 AAA domain-containing protein [Lentinula aff. detonsa]